MLRKQRKQQMEQALRYKFSNKDNWIFTSMFGKHYSMSWLSQEFKSMCISAGLTNITAHALRHTHATLLRDAGVSLDVISKQLRHVNILVTSNYYAHTTPEIKQKTANITQDIFTNIKKKKAPDKVSEAK